MSFKISKELQTTLTYIFQLPPENRSREQLTLLSNYLITGNYFSNIKDREDLYEISKHIKLKSYTPETVIFKQNTQGLRFFIILSGKVVGYKENNSQEKYLFSLEQGQSFGEMALLSDSLRMCSIKAVENTDLIVITKEVYTQYEGNSRSKYLEQTEKYLHENFLFNKIGRDTRLKIARKGFFKVFEAKKNIILEGELTNYVYIIKYGQVALKKKILKSKLDKGKIKKNHLGEFKKLPKNFKMEIKTIENNGYFGAYEMFYKLPSQFTVVSKTQVSIIMLSSNELFKTMSTDDINIIKKNILLPFSDEEFINFYLEHKIWKRFKKKVVETEMMYAQKKKGFRDSTNFTLQSKKKKNYKKELNYFKKNGTFKIDCKSIYYPKITKIL